MSDMTPESPQSTSTPETAQTPETPVSAKVDRLVQNDTPTISDQELLADNKRLNLVLDIPVTLSVKIGEAKISVRDLLQLNSGSIVELSRAAHEPFDILVNGTLIAQGEVVVVEDHFGIRLTDVVSPTERLQNLG